jgi:hypothetical protein
MISPQLLQSTANLLKEADPDDFKDRVAEVGAILAEHKWNDYCESIEDPWLRGVTAICLENQDIMFQDTPGYQVQKAIRELQDLNELTTTSNIATIDTIANPVIRAAVPNFIANDLVSVQPMLNKTSMVVFMKAVYGDTKGDVQAGIDPTDYPSAWVGSSRVENEVVFEKVGTDLVATIAANLSWTTVRPGSLMMVVTDASDSYMLRDDGAGDFGTNSGITSNKIDYDTGVIDIDFATAPAGTDAVKVVATYEYNNEATENIPQMDLQLNSSPVTAEPYKMRVRWSVESAQHLMSMFGMSAEVEFGGYVANELKSQTDRRVIHEIETRATARPTEWDANPEDGVPYVQHKLEFADVLVEASYNILDATKSAEGNWVLMGTGIGHIVDTLPGFVGNGVSGVKGARETGTLNGKWRCFVDPYRDDQNTYTVGYKSGNLMEAGIIFAPWIPLYMTPTTTLDDFLSRKGFQTQFAVKYVDGDYYSKGRVVPVNRKRT